MSERRVKLKKVSAPKATEVIADDNMDPTAVLVNTLQRDGRFDRLKAFFDKHGKVSGDQLVKTISDDITPSEKKLLTPDRIRSLYDLVDVHKNGTITWDMFTSFFLDAAILARLHYERVETLTPWEMGEIPLDVGCHRPAKLKHMDTQDSILVVDASNAVHVLDATDPKSVGTRRLNISLTAAIIDSEFVSGEDLYAVTTAASELVLFDPHLVNTAATKSRAPMHIVSWNPIAKTLFAGDRDGYITMWQADRSPTDRVLPPRLQDTWHFRDSSVAAFDHHCKNGLVAIGFKDGTVILVQPFTGRREREFNAGSPINCLAITEHQHGILVGTSEPDPGLWTLGSGDDGKPFPLQSRASPHVSPIVSLLCFPHSPQAISSDFGGVIKFWDLRTFTCLQTFSMTLRDPKACWVSFVHDTACQKIYMCDRKNIITYEMVDEEEEQSKKGYVSFVGVSMLTDRIITANVGTLRVWDTSEGRMLAEVDDIIGTEITAMTIDDTGGRAYLGTRYGAVWVINTANAGKLQRFPRAHKKEVCSLCFVRHANLSISCAVDGSGSILKPLVMNAQTDHMRLTCQAAFRGMRGRLCEYIGDPLFLIVAGNEDNAVTVFDCKNVAKNLSIMALFTVQLPGVELPMNMFKPRSRVFLDSTEIKGFGVAVADNFIVTVIDLTEARSSSVKEGYICARWFNDPKCEISITGLVTDVSPLRQTLYVADDSGGICIVNMSPLISDGSGDPQVVGRVSQTVPITAVACANPTELVVGLGDGTVDRISEGLGYASMWSGTHKSRMQHSGNPRPLEFIAIKHQNRYDKRSRRRTSLLARGEEFVKKKAVPAFMMGIHRRRSSVTSQGSQQGRSISPRSEIGSPTKSPSMGDSPNAFSGIGGRPFSASVGAGVSRRGSVAESTRSVSDQSDFPVPLQQPGSFNAPQSQLSRPTTTAGIPSQTSPYETSEKQREWVRNQLSTLCAGYTYQEPEMLAKEEPPAWVTRNLKIPVFISPDPFSSAISTEDAVEDDAPKALREAYHEDTRQSKAQKVMDSLISKADMVRRRMDNEPPAFVQVKRFVGCPVDKVPELPHAISAQEEAMRVALHPHAVPHSLLQPLMQHDDHEQMIASDLNAIAMEELKAHIDGRMERRQAALTLSRPPSRTSQQHATPSPSPLPAPNMRVKSRPGSQKPSRASVPVPTNDMSRIVSLEQSLRSPVNTTAASLTPSPHTAALRSSAPASRAMTPDVISLAAAPKHQQHHNKRTLRRGLAMAPDPELHLPPRPQSVSSKVTPPADDLLQGGQRRAVASRGSVRAKPEQEVPLWIRNRM